MNPEPPIARVDRAASPPDAASSKRRVLVELLVLAAFAAAFLVTFQSRPGYVDVALAVVAVAFVVLSHGRSRRLWTAEAADPRPLAARLAASARATGLFTAAALLVLLAVGVAIAHAGGGWEAAFARVTNWHFALAFLLYLPWALLQQFVFQIYLLGRLLVLLPLAPAVGITAIAFSSVHFPRAPVMLVTLFAGAAWALLYRRYRTILPLAVSHALLGSALHYWVFGRDLAASWLGIR